MATRKRLSDLLREEAKKSLEEAEQPAGSQRRSHSKAQKSTTAKDENVADDGGNSDDEKEGEAIAPLPSADPPSVASRKSASTRATKVESKPDPSPGDDMTAKVAELQDTINDLQASLKTAQQVEQALRQELATLEASLKEREQVTQGLEAELEKARKNSAELDHTKRLVLQLSEGNIQLTKELETLKQQKQSAPHSSGIVTANQALRQILRHPVLPTIPSTNFSDEDIGWVD